MYSFQYFSVHFTIKILHKDSFMQKKSFPKEGSLSGFQKRKYLLLSSIDIPIDYSLHPHRSLPELLHRRNHLPSGLVHDRTRLHRITRPAFLLFQQFIKIIDDYDYMTNLFGFSSCNHLCRIGNDSLSHTALFQQCFFMYFCHSFLFV